MCFLHSVLNNGFRIRVPQIGYVPQIRQLSSIYYEVSWKYIKECIEDSLKAPKYTFRDVLNFVANSQ